MLYHLEQTEQNLLGIKAGDFLLVKLLGILALWRTAHRFSSSYKKEPKNVKEVMTDEYRINTMCSRALANEPDLLREKLKSMAFCMNSSMNLCTQINTFPEYSHVL